MRVAVIGAGAAGLASARHIVDHGFDCQVYEMASELGGTWIYTDEVGRDKYGYPIHTAMYKGLRTNLPKEIMGFPDFPIPEQTESYLLREDILKFLNLYADHFNLRPTIKFNEIVIDIRPHLEDKWQIRSAHKPTKQVTTDVYDAVMVCTGRYGTPYKARIPGEANFKGSIIHSHQYRSSEPYKNRKVLVIGAGPSGLDVALRLSAVAEYVILSHHDLEKGPKLEGLPNVSNRCEVRRINDEDVEFVDGSVSPCDSIIYCTGYTQSFPFLHESCGVTVENNCVRPLYKHMVHVKKPTMCFIGVPYQTCPFQMFDLQARFYCQYLNGSMSLPDTEDDVKEHVLGPRQQEYYDDLAATAKITPIPPVFAKLYHAAVERGFNNLLTFRNDRYKIVDEDCYVRVNSE